jgi:Mn-dependent DtxR family transcriptional regulator
MVDDAEYNEMKDRIKEYLAGLETKPVDTTINIAKALGMKRRDASKILARMETDGLVQSAGVTAGVAGYKLLQ